MVDSVKFRVLIVSESMHVLLALVPPMQSGSELPKLDSGADNASLLPLCSSRYLFTCKDGDVGREIRIKLI